MRGRNGMGRLAVVAALALFSVSAAAQVGVAQGGGPLDVRLTASKIVKAADGKETAQVATAAKPGDVIEYRAIYTNKGKGTLSNVEATLPVPAGLEYTPNTALPSGVLASVDGSLFLPVPLKRKVQRDGREVEQAVPYGEYRALRWKLGEIPAGDNTAVSARMRLTPTITPSQQQAALSSAK